MYCQYVFYMVPISNKHLEKIDIIIEVFSIVNNKFKSFFLHTTS